VIFKRWRRTDPAAAIGAFWAWWAGARPRAEKLIAGGSDDRLIAELGDAVTAIHPELQWEFTAGTTSRHLLVVSAAGDPALRSLAERWRRAGPAPDATFGYTTSRQGDPAALDEAKLSIAGHELDLSGLRFAAEVDEDRDCVHVQVWHPAFPGMPAEARGQVTFLALDWVLGEDAVEIWVGGVDTATGPGPSLTARDLAAVIAGMAPPPGAEPRWRAMSGVRDGRPMVATAQTPLRAARWPGHDLHIRIDVPYRDRDANGFPAKAAFPALYALEDHLQKYADGAVVVAHETSDGVRTTHLYANSPAASEALKPLFVSWPDGRIRMTVTPDPAWNEVGHLNPQLR
jgi:hypothetical protein